MSDRFSNPIAFGRRFGVVLAPLTRFPSERLSGVALARNNGRVAYESDVPIGRGNPYRKGTKRHAAFIEGYQWAENRASLSDKSHEGGER